MAKYPIQVLGGPSPVSITAGTAAAVTTPTDDLGPEGFQLGRLYLTATGGNLTRAWITPAGIEFAGDKLTQGYVPALMFAHDAVGSPRFGHFIRAKQTLKVTIDGAANVEMLSAWSPSSGPGPQEMRAGRSIVAYGQDSAPASLAAGASVDLTITPDEDGVLGRFFIQDAGANALMNQLHVTAVYLSGTRIWHGDTPASVFAHNSTAAPWLNVPLRAGEHTITLTVKNDDGSNAAYPIVGAVVIG